MIFHNPKVVTNHMMRTSQLLPFMSVHRLRDDNVIPELFVGEKVGTKKFPPMVKQNYAHFGLFIDHLFINMYINCHEGSHANAIPIDGFYSKDWEDVYIELHRYTCNLFRLPIDDVCIANTMNYFKGMNTFVKSITQEGFVFETEETFDAIQLHPDVVVGDAVYDIKTTGNMFGEKMYPHLTLQLLAYCAFRRALGHVVNKVGVILPMQRQIVEQDVSGWDSSRYLMTLMGAFNHATATPSMFDLITILGARQTHIGNHTGKEGSVLNTIKKVTSHLSNIAIQIFLRAPQQFRGKVGGSFSKADRREVRRLCKEHNIRLYIHAPHVINLCRESDEIDTIKDDLIRTRWLKGKGVVFHVGKRASKTKARPAMTETLAECLDCMERKIRQLLEFSSENTPLCIETPAKQGKKKERDRGEVLSNIEAMIDFYNRFSDDEKKRFKICVDTCHVFSSGYWPMDYILELAERCPGSIRLIHYNDSSVPLGACNDLHHPVGGGFMNIMKAIQEQRIYRFEKEHIGISEMARVANWCVANNVDGVVE